MESFIKSHLFFIHYSKTNPNDAKLLMESLRDTWGCYLEFKDESIFNDLWDSLQWVIPSRIKKEFETKWRNGERDVS